MLRRRSASVVFRILAACWFALGTLLGNAFHLHEHADETPCTGPAAHDHGACESKSLTASFGHPAPTAAPEIACPACSYLSQSQMSAGGAYTVCRAYVTAQRSHRKSIILAERTDHAFDSRGPPFSLPIA
jgi:hypothetical protein